MISLSSDSSRDGANVKHRKIATECEVPVILCLRLCTLSQGHNGKLASAGNNGGQKILKLAKRGASIIFILWYNWKRFL